MQRLRLQTFGLWGLTLSTSLVAACGDPCLDDGAGRRGAECVGQTGADSTGTGAETETGEETETGDTMDSNTETSGEDEGGETWCSDDDMDGYGDAEDCEEVPAGEEPPPNSVPEEQASDCDDDDAATFPGAAELEDPDACMTDTDDDGWGDDMPSNPNAEAGSDCNDGNANAFPGAAELDDPDACMEDDDDDGWGDAMPGGNATIPGTDCDDNDSLVAACEVWCEDADSDSFGNPDSCVLLVPGEEPPAGYVMDNTDCDDGNANAFPGAAELDDPEACMLDADDDGWGDDMPPEGVDAGRDCDDADMGRVVCVDAIPACVDTTLGNDAQLMATATGGDGNYVYAWTPVETLDDPGVPDPIATPLDITTYTVNVSDGLNNMGSDEITLHITDKSWVLGGPDAECEAIGFLGEPALHDFSPDGTQTCTTSNSDPTAFICPTVHEQVRITGTMVVNTVDDDDIIGFVWGWQDINQFYLFQWKQTQQAWFNCNGPAGMMVKKFDAQGPLLQADFACDTDTGNASVLLSPADIYDQGWIDNREYGVEVLYDTDQTEITITDLSDDSQVANFVVMDGSYPSGQFGTYDFSQEQACNGPWQSSCI